MSTQGDPDPDPDDYERRCEILARAIEALPREKRPTQKVIAGWADLDSPTAIWALLSRRDSGRPTVERLRKIASKLKLSEAEVQRRMARLAETQRSFLKPPPDGVLPPTVGAVNAQAFLLQAACNGSEFAVALRDLYTEEECESYPYSRDLLDHPVRSSFQVYPDEIVEECFVNADRTPVTSEPPGAFFLTRGRALEFEAKRSRLLGGDQPRLQKLSGWSFQMSPDFVLIDAGRGDEEIAPHRSCFAHEFAKRGSYQGALEWLREELAEACFLTSPKFLSRRFLQELLAALEIEVRPGSLRNAGVVRHALSYLNDGLLQDRCVAVGGGPHFWAAYSDMSRRGGNLRVLVTDEDLIGRPEGMRMPDDTQSRPLGNRQDLDRPGWSEQWQGLRGEWPETGIIAVRCRGDADASADALGRYLRVISKRVRDRWTPGDLKERRRLARIVLEGFDYWGGAGTRMSIEHMIEFIEYGMTLTPGGVDDGLTAL